MHRKTKMDLILPIKTKNINKLGKVLEIKAEKINYLD
jgi:hypothetical protein